MSSTEAEKFGQIRDKYGLGHSGMRYPTLSDYRPIPADEYGTLFLPERLAQGLSRRGAQ